tara:strand:- start:577 stop:1131 length:555 start_codon:yes stop_codon:yes gene_type:complete
MEYTEENLTEEMVDNIWAAMMTKTCGDPDTTTTYVSISAQKEDQLGLQWSAVGTYHDKDDVELFDFELEDGQNNGSVILGIYPPNEGVGLPEQTGVICRFYPLEATPLAIKKLIHSTTVQENSRKMSYDLTMTGCSKAHKHWNDYAAQIGAKIITYKGTAEQLHIFDELFWKDPIAAKKLHEDV